MSKFFKKSVDFLNFKAALTVAVILFCAVGAVHCFAGMFVPSKPVIAVENANNILCGDPLTQDDSHASIVDRCRRLVNIFRIPVRRNIVPKVPVDGTVVLPVIRSLEVTAVQTFYCQREYIFVFFHHLHRALPVRAGPIAA